MDAECFDVAVVGAGPAGSVAAYAAAQRGFTVALIDRQVFPRDKTCGDAIGPGVVHVAHRLGFDEIFHDHAPIHAITVFGPDGSRLESAIPRVDGQDVHGYVMPRLDFDNRIFRIAVKQGARDFTGMRFVSMNAAQNYQWIDLCGNAKNTHTHTHTN